MTDRTPLQAAAKRVYDALTDAQSYCLDMQIDAKGGTGTDLQFCYRLEQDIERLFQTLQHLMHQDDCE